MKILSVRHLSVEYTSKRWHKRLLNDMSLDIYAGEVLGLVGESGAGKSMAAMTILGLINMPILQCGGEIWLRGERIDHLSPYHRQRMRGRRITGVFQDAVASLNPLLTISQQLVSTLRAHFAISKEQAKRRAADLLESLGVPAAQDRLDQYPHQLSGGMCQRVAIAMALAAEPDLLIADEPTSSLDVCAQAQIMDILKRSCKQRGTALLLISHDIGVLAEVCDRVAIMLAGRVVEVGSIWEVTHRPLHPYSQALMACVPGIETDVACWQSLSDGPTPASSAAVNQVRCNE